MEYAILYFGMVLTASGQAAFTSPVSSTEVSNHSRYHDQVEFISNFLLSTTNDSSSSLLAKEIKQSTQEEKSVFSAFKTNKTTTNEVQVPAIVSSVIDTLPVQRRVPRRVGVKARQYRHSTRVQVVQPVRHLLPPFQDEIVPQFSLSSPAPFSLKPILITPLATTIISTTTLPTTEAVSEVLQNEVKSESSQSAAIPQHRRVFIPPPLRYLLPPFFYENYINAQSSTTQTPVTANFSALVDDYTSTNQPVSDTNTVEHEHVSPIIVIETVSEADIEVRPWSQQTVSVSEYSTAYVRDSPYNEVSSEVNPINNPSTSNYDSLTPTTSAPRPFQFDNSSQYGEYKAVVYDNYSSRIKSKEFSPSQRINVNNNHENYSSRSTTSRTLTTIAASPFPILRGPNIEQTLFETGDFQRSDTSSNDSEDTTVSLMNRPLLAQAVADAGMKITVMKEDQVSRSKLSRGKYKYNHLNQFQFQGEERSRESKLSVAESSYYNDRRGVKNLPEEAEIQVIPGQPGRDYPTLTKPPTDSTFSCRSVSYHRGYVADPSTGCQVFYICVGNGGGEPMLCPNGTLFSQDFLVCDWWYNVDCQSQT